MHISLARVESLRSFLFREALLCRSKSRSAAQRTLDTTARMASRTEKLFVLPPPVGAGIHSRGVKGARSVELSCTTQYEVSSRRNRSRTELLTR